MTHDSELVERFGYTPRMSEPVSPIERNLDEVYVRYSDYEALRARLAEVERERDAANAALEQR